MYFVGLVEAYLELIAEVVAEVSGEAKKIYMITIKFQCIFFFVSVPHTC